MSKGMVNFYICNAIGQNLALFWDYRKRTKSKVCQKMAMLEQLNDELLCSQFNPKGCYWGPL